MARYVDIDKHVYVRYIDERSNEIVTSLHTIAEILQDTVGLFPVEDDVTKVIRCKDCKHGQYDFMLNHYWCNGKAYTATWFCAGGERKGESDGENIS